MRSETLRKRLADPDAARTLGQIIERAIVLTGKTKQDVSFAMGYPDQSALSRWISGAETAQMAKLWALGEWMQNALLVALAEAAVSPAVAVSSVVTVPHVKAVSA